MPSYRQHSTFFESGPVPQPAPVLTVHTIIRFASAPPTITTHEEVRCKTSTQHPWTPTPEPKVHFSSTSSFSRSTSPSVHNSWGSSHQSSESSSDHESDLTSIPSDNEAETSSIPKPPGEPGRPKSGGYNLKHASRLKAFDTIKVGHCVSRSIPANSLPCTAICCQLSQKLEWDWHSEELPFTKTQCIRIYIQNSMYFTSSSSIPLNLPSQVQVKYPELWKFVKCWPIEDMLKNYLKNSSNKWRTAQKKKQLDLGLIKGKTKKDKSRDSSCTKSP